MAPKVHVDFRVLMIVVAAASAVVAAAAAGVGVGRSEVAVGGRAGGEHRPYWASSSRN